MLFFISLQENITSFHTACLQRLFCFLFIYLFIECNICVEIGMQYVCIDFYYLYNFLLNVGWGEPWPRLRTQHKEVLRGYYIILH